jgi:hypothetical protein
MRAIHLSRDARHRHDLDDAADERGGFGGGDVAAARRAAQRINLDRAAGRGLQRHCRRADRGRRPSRGLPPPVERYEATIVPGAVSRP